MGCRTDKGTVHRRRPDRIGRETDEQASLIMDARVVLKAEKSVNTRACRAVTAAVTETCLAEATSGNIGRTMVLRSAS